jgi:hypothetical protein
MTDFSMDQRDHVTLCEALDRVLNKGAVVAGEITLSVANIDLIYVSLQLIVTSIETAREQIFLSGGSLYESDRLS